MNKRDILIHQIDQEMHLSMLKTRAVVIVAGYYRMTQIGSLKDSTGFY